jgi:predicted nucleic-acid-binding protein
VIGLDSNVLVRYFVQDDPHQTKLAIRILETRTPSDPGWVSVAVLVELLWVLSRTYKRKQHSITQVVEHLLASDDIALEQEEFVSRALALYRTGKADFADCLIAAAAKAAGCTRIVTFDRIAAHDAGMELIT